MVISLTLPWILLLTLYLLGLMPLPLYFHLFLLLLLFLILLLLLFLLITRRVRAAWDLGVGGGASLGPLQLKREENNKQIESFT